MKRILTGFLATLLAFVSFAQDNNPYNGKGTDFNTSYTLIKNDYAAGKVTRFDERTIAAYSRKIPLGATMTADLSAQILHTMNAPDFNLTTFIQQSNLTPFSQQVFLDVLTKPLPDRTYQENIRIKVDAVKLAEIPEAERELVLSLLAVAYNLKDILPANARQGCIISGPDGSGEGTPGQCAVAGAVIGGLIGWGICGFWCALGGAIVGGVIGGLC
jgi:hypothetical protein